MKITFIEEKISGLQAIKKRHFIRLLIKIYFKKILSFFSGCNLLKTNKNIYSLYHKRYY